MDDIFDVDLDKLEEDNICGPERYGDEAEEIRLSESLEIRQDYPIIVRPHVTLAGFFLIVDGYRRNRAARRAGLKTLKAIKVDKDLTPQEVRLLQLRTDLHKKHLTAYQRSMAAIALEKDNPGLTIKQLAALIEIDEALLWKYMQIKKLGSEAVEAYKSGVLLMTEMVEIAKHSHDGQIPLLSLKATGANRDEIAQASKKRRSGKGKSTGIDSSASTSSKSASVKIVISGATIILKAKNGLSLTEVSSLLLNAHREAKDGIEDGLSATSFQRVMADRAKKSQVSPRPTTADKPDELAAV